MICIGPHTITVQCCPLFHVLKMKKISLHMCVQIKPIVDQATRALIAQFIKDLNHAVGHQGGAADDEPSTMQGLGARLSKWWGEHHGVGNGKGTSAAGLLAKNSQADVQRAIAYTLSLVQRRSEAVENNKVRDFVWGEAGRLLSEMNQGYQNRTEDKEDGSRCSDRWHGVMGSIPTAGCHVIYSMNVAG